MSTKIESNRKPGARMNHVLFNPDWVGSTGFMTEALGVVKGKNDPWLMGLQVINQPVDTSRSSSRRIHTLQMIERACTASSVDDRPMRFRIRDRAVTQEVQGMADNHATGRRFNYKGIATITRSGITVKISGDNWEPIPIAGPYSILEVWVPMSNANMPKSYSPIWVQSTTLLQAHGDWMPQFMEGFHRCAFQILGDMLRASSIGHATFTRTSESVSSRSAMQRKFSLSERAMSAYGKYIRRNLGLADTEAWITDEARAAYRSIVEHALDASRESFTASLGHYDQAVMIYIDFCKKVGMQGPVRMDDILLETPVSAWTSPMPTAEVA